MYFASFFHFYFIYFILLMAATLCTVYILLITTTTFNYLVDWSPVTNRFSLGINKLFLILIVGQRNC